MTTLNKLRVLQEKQKNQALNQEDNLALLNYIVDLAAEWGISDADNLKPIRLIIENPIQWRRHGLSIKHVLEITTLLSTSMSNISASPENIAIVENIQNLTDLNFLNLLNVLDEEDVVKTVSSVDPDEFEDIPVDNGTDFEDLDLPATTTATLSNGETVEMNIAWAEGDYDGDVAGTYVLDGTLVPPNSKITSTIELEVSIVVAIL